MKKKLKQYKLFFYLILFSCNPNSIDQANPLNLRDIDIIGKYWFNIFFIRYINKIFENITTITNEIAFGNV
jgi:hypothetical protein